MAEMIDTATDQVHGDVGFRTDREDKSKECEPCKVDNTLLSAVGWCETCDEMLCNDCYKSHCRLKITRNHQLWSLEEMSSRSQKKKVTSKCQKHDGKRLKYFCNDHEELGCSECFVTKHRPCSKVVCISHLTTRESNEFKALQLLLSKLEERLQTMEETKERNLGTTSRQHDEAIAGIQEAGEKLKALIDTIVKEQIAKAEVVKADNIVNISKVDEMMKELGGNLTTTRDMLAAVKGDNTQLFITMKHIQGEAKVLESKVGDSEQKNTIKEYEFVLNPELARLLDTTKELGTLIDTRELNMEKATDEIVDEFEVRRLRFKGDYWPGSRRLTFGLQMSTDRDIRLMYVLMYTCRRSDTNVELSIKEGDKCLVSCSSNHAYTSEDVVAVKVAGDRGVSGIPLHAGHRYDVIVTITGDEIRSGESDLRKVNAQGVKFSLINLNLPGTTTVKDGQIPGFRFSLI